MLIAKVLSVLSIKRRFRSLILRDKIIILRDKYEIIVLINIDNEEIFIS